MSRAPRSGVATPRSWLLPLVPVYAAAVTAKNAAYDHGLLQARRLQDPVISVGNLSVGGAGKTPLVIYLAQLLAARGAAVDVLSRGYGRQSKAVEQVRLDGFASAWKEPSTAQGQVFSPHETTGAGASRYGDEPLLIAQAAGVPVYVGASRYAAGLLAEQHASRVPRVHLLDDGFQHRQLARAVDIVVIHPSDLRQSLLPAGRLREPLASLQRASIAVLGEVESGAARDLTLLRKRFPSLSIWRMTREIVLAPHPEPAIAFCGIAHWEEFFASLERAGASLRDTHAFRDHHVYTDPDMAKLIGSLRATGARTLLTTEKDLVRLSARHRELLGTAATRSRLFRYGLQFAMKELRLSSCWHLPDFPCDHLRCLAGVSEAWPILRARDAGRVPAVRAMPNPMRKWMFATTRHSAAGAHRALRRDGRHPPCAPRRYSAP